MSEGIIFPLMGMEKDEFIDSLQDRIFSFLVNNMKMTVEIVLLLNRIYQSNEGIADISTKIAENTIYICKGHIVKHEPKLPEIHYREN